MDKFQAFGKNISASFTPFAARTQQYVKEQLGQVQDKTELPPEYLALEKRIDALKQVHTKLLAVAAQYSNESYDYPGNIRENFTDLSRTVSERVKLLSAASTPAEAQAALTSPASSATAPQPKTFNHALARASLAGSQLLAPSTSAAGDDALARALQRFALAEEQLGDARLAQDARVQNRFLAGWSATLHSGLGAAARARKAVERARLELDALKASASPSQQNDPRHAAAVEKAEDEFVNATEEAVSVMKNTLDTPEPLRNLAELVAAQREFHARATQVLDELVPEIEQLQTDQEAVYRQSRDTA